MKNPSASCTIYGNQYFDQVSLAGLGPVEVKVGAIQSQTDNFDTKKAVGGLMGLGGFDGEDVLATLANAGKCDRIWGLCMFQGRSSNGTMTVGGVDNKLADGGIQYVPDTGFIYNTVDVSTLTLGGQQIHVGDGDPRQRNKHSVVGLLCVQPRSTGHVLGQFLVELQWLLVKQVF